MQLILRRAHKWCKYEAGNFQKQKQHIMVLMDDAQARKDFATLQTLQSQFDEVLQHEKIFWHQRSRVHWLTLGDKNTNYFHQKATRRKCRNLINSLQNENENWTSNDVELG